MLPVYNSDGVYHRHGPLPLSGSPGSSSSTVRYFTSGLGRGSRRRWVMTALQIIIALCVLLPLVLIVTDRSKLWSSGSSNWGGRKALIQSPQTFPAAYLRNLVLVAGHAVYTGVDFSQATHESSWFLEEYQKVPGEAQSFVDHIELGIRQAASDPTAMLLFSGGQTRQAAGPRSEGLIYWVVAEAASWFNMSIVRNRTFTEEHARDSFENLLFGLCRFYELTGHYPDNIVVVSYTLKEERFKNLHRQALRFPVDHFDFVGTPVPPEATGAQAGEAKTVAAFQENPYGCTGELLEKRLRRDPFAVGPIHPSRCPDMASLLAHCSIHLFEGQVPWQSQN